jgi:hypothetical protein
VVGALEVSYKAATPEATIVAEVEAHLALVATHGEDAANWAGVTLDGAGARRLLEAVKPTAIAGLRDVSGMEAQKNIDVFGKDTIEASIPPMTGRRFNVERAQMGEKTAVGVAGEKVKHGNALDLAAHADHLDGATTTTHAALAADSLIVDTNVLAAIKELMTGDAWSGLQAHKQAGINMLRQRANPRLPPLTGDPPARDMDSIIGKGHDLRVANSALGESAPVAGFDRSGFELSLTTRDDPQYVRVLDELATGPEPVGQSKGFADRAIVADTMFAKGQAKPTLMTGDKHLVLPLFKKYGPGKTTRLRQELGQSMMKAIAEKFPAGFDADIPDGSGGLKTITILLMVA